jgi:hypothetical protein
LINNSSAVDRQKQTLPGKRTPDMNGEMIILQSIDWDKLDGSLSKYTYFSVITQLKDKYQPN